MNERAKKLAMIRSVRTVIVGVDIAKKKHWACIMDAQTEVPLGRAFSFDNTKDGFVRLVEEARRARDKAGAEHIVVGMEPSGHYWKPLASSLAAAGLTVVTVNPMHVSRAKEFDDNSPTKNDRKDAWVIARRVGDADFFIWREPEDVYAELRGLAQAREQLAERLNMVMNQLHSLLDEYFPEYPTVFSDLLCRASLQALRSYPFPADVLEISEERLAETFKIATKSRVGVKRARALREAAMRSIGVRKGLKAARIRLKTILADIDRWRKQMVEVQAAMAKALRDTDTGAFLLSVPGLGTAAVASILGEVGDLDRYQDWRQLRKLAGFNLTEHSSGQHQGETHISKRGRPRLRHVLYVAAMTLITHNREFGDLYRYFRSRPVNPLKGKEALIAVACKLLRIIFTLGRNRIAYDAEKALGAKRVEQLAA